MVKEQIQDKQKTRVTRHSIKKPRQEVDPSNRPARGRPPKAKIETTPQKTQKIFTKEFVNFGEEFLKAKLQNHYVWRQQYANTAPVVIQKIKSKCSQKQSSIQSLNTIIKNMGNLMQPEVAVQFRNACQLCVDRYESECNLIDTQNELWNLISKSSQYDYLGLRSTQIPSGKRKIDQSSLKKFIQLTVKLIYDEFSKPKQIE